jgi:nucleoside-diphosphate-sugar epimerase
MNLITGANGFLGSYLCRYLLLQDQPVRGLRRKHSDMRLVDDIKNKIDWVDADINDLVALEEAMQGVVNVYHTAAVISYAENKRNLLMHVNVEGTANVVNLCLERGIKKLLHVSSSAALGKKQNQVEVTEDIPWERNKNTSNYSISKHLAEREVWRGIAEGLQAVIINPTIIVGAGNWHQGSCKIFTTVNNGFRFYTEGTTGYVDVRDVAQIAYQLMQSTITGEKFIVSAENIQFRDYFFMIADALGKKRPDIKAGRILSDFAWRADAMKYLFTGKEPTVTKQTARIANSTFHFSNAKLVNTLQHNFIPIRQSVVESAKLFKEFERTGKFGHLDFT